MRKKTIFIALASIMLFQAIFLANFRALVFNQGYYEKNFEKTGTYSRIPDANSAASDLIDYFQGKNRVSMIFDERESSHLEDVKSLIQKTNTYLYLLIFSLLIILFASVFLLSKGFHEFILKILFLPAAAVLAVSLILFVAYNFFPQLFEAFHLTFFQPGSYIFPEDSNLIKMFPEEFFMNFTYDIIKNSTITSVIMIAASLFFKKAYS